MDTDGVEALMKEEGVDIVIEDFDFVLPYAQNGYTGTRTEATARASPANQ